MPPPLKFDPAYFENKFLEYMKQFTVPTAPPTPMPIPTAPKLQVPVKDVVREGIKKYMEETGAVTGGTAGAAAGTSGTLAAPTILSAKAIPSAAALTPSAPAASAAPVGASGLSAVAIPAAFLAAGIYSKEHPWGEKLLRGAGLMGRPAAERKFSMDDALQHNAFSNQISGFEYIPQETRAALIKEALDRHYLKTSNKGYRTVDLQGNAVGAGEHVPYTVVGPAEKNPYYFKAPTNPGSSYEAWDPFVERVRSEIEKAKLSGLIPGSPAASDAFMSNMRAVQNPFEKVAALQSKRREVHD